MPTSRLRRKVGVPITCTVSVLDLLDGLMIASLLIWVFLDLNLHGQEGMV